MKNTLTFLLCFTTVTLALAQSPTGIVEQAGDAKTPRQRVGPLIFFDEAQPEIFPATWLTPAINAKAELLDEMHKQQSKQVVERALAKYSASVVNDNLKKIYLLGRLEYNGVATGGTNSRSAVYLVNSGKYSAEVIERIFHAEFSSILLRNFPQHLDQTKWQQINPADFSYRGTGVQAIKQKQASQRFDVALHQEGFLHEYAKASIEEDFNSFAGRLFVGDAALWSVMKQYPKLMAKAELTIDFYGKLDARFTKDLFLSFREPKQPEPTNENDKQ